MSLLIFEVTSCRFTEKSNLTSEQRKHSSIISLQIQKRFILQINHNTQMLAQKCLIAIQTKTRYKHPVNTLAPFTV